MTDLELLGAVLHRYLTADDSQPFFYINPDDLVLDGGVLISPDEEKALLRTTAGRIDAPGLRHIHPTYMQ